MADMSYINNNVEYNPVTNEFTYLGNSFTDIDGKFSQMKERQDEARKLLHSWMDFSNHDDRKLITLYPMLDAQLFYDHLANKDIKTFSDELLRMSEDMDSFSIENMNFFKICSDYFNQYLVDSKSIIENENDLNFDSLVEDFFNFNRVIFNQYEKAQYENGSIKKAS